MSEIVRICEYGGVDRVTVTQVTSLTGTVNGICEGCKVTRGANFRLPIDGKLHTLAGATGKITYCVEVPFATSSERGLT